MVKINEKLIPQKQKNLQQNYEKHVPHLIKYMGSKRRILDSVIGAIDEIYDGGVVCDLFAGTSILSGALGKIVPVHSNDIQAYSGILASTYLSNYNWEDFSHTFIDDIIQAASIHVTEFKKKFPNLNYNYSAELTLNQFVRLERDQRNLLSYNFDASPYHLYTKYYSGTYWSFEQCIWIDAIRRVADDYLNSPVYNVILASLMHSMSYTSQSTGHYAQFREAKTEKSKNDILIYRLREIQVYFRAKFLQLKKHLGHNEQCHRVTCLDYRQCLEDLTPGSLVYADPPYAFVHYSRFYHAIETLVKYDYPQVDHKGRYRVDRHQSPFGRRTEVRNAFQSLFLGIKAKKSNLVLSYSNTGMISLKEIIEIANVALGNLYTVAYKELKYKHSTMGRTEDKNKEVVEYLISVKKK